MRWKTILWCLTLAGVWGTVGPMEILANPPGIDLPPVEDEKERWEKGDGSTFGVGTLGGDEDTCKAGSRAFIEHRASDGTVLWRRQHQGDAGCDNTGSQPLFADFTGFDSTFAVTSQMHGVLEDPLTGDVYAVGQVLLAWDDGIGTTTGWGAVVGHWDGNGNLLRDVYLGSTPGGPPLSAPSCQTSCDQDPGSTGPGWIGEYGGLALALDGQEVVITGWYREYPDRERDAFVARFVGDPMLPLWTLESGLPGDDVGRAVAVNDLGESFLAGFSGADRDVLLARVQDDSTVGAVQLLTGPKDDEGTAVSFDSQGHVVVDGFFTSTLTVGSQVLSVAQGKVEGFSATFDGNLQPLSAQQVPLAAGNLLADTSPALSTRKIRMPSLPNPLADPPDVHDAIPLDFAVTAGTLERGGLEEIRSSDNRYMRVVADETGLLEIQVWFDPDPRPDPMPLYLGTVRAEVLTEHCYTATILVNGIAGPDFEVAGQRQLCPSAEPILEVPISKEFSTALGFDGQVLLEPGDRLHVKLRIQFHAVPITLPPGILPQTTGQDSSVDQISAEIEY